MGATFSPFSKDLAVCSSTSKEEVPVWRTSCWESTCSWSSHLTVLLSIQKAIFNNIASNNTMYNQYTLHCSIAALPEFHHSRINTNINRELTKPSFLIQDERDLGKTTAKEEVLDHSGLQGLGLSLELTARLQRLDANPFTRGSEVHYKPVYRPHYEEPPRPFLSQDESIYPEGNPFQSSKVIPYLYEANIRAVETEQPSSLNLSREVFGFAEQAAANDPQEVRVQQILAEFGSSDQFQSQNQGKDNRRPNNYIPQHEDHPKYNHYQPEEPYLPRQETGREWPIKEMPVFSPSIPDLLTKDENSRMEENRKSVSIINRLNYEPSEPVSDMTLKIPFTKSIVRQQDKEEETDPGKLWRKASVEMVGQGQEKGFQHPPPSIVVRGGVYNLVPVF